MHFTVSSKRLKYDITFYGKYSIICGDSGTGKTNLCKLVRGVRLGDKLTKIDSDLPLYAPDLGEDGDKLLTMKEHIVIIDESNILLKRPDIASLLQNSNNYFLIISRDNYDFLPVCVESIYEMKTESIRHWIEPLYSVSSDRKFDNIKYIVTEDSVSGDKFF